MILILKQSPISEAGNFIRNPNFNLGKILILLLLTKGLFLIKLDMANCRYYLPEIAYPCPKELRNYKVQ